MKDYKESIKEYLFIINQSLCNINGRLRGISESNQKFVLESNIYDVYIGSTNSFSGANYDIYETNIELRVVFNHNLIVSETYQHRHYNSKEETEFLNKTKEESYKKLYYNLVNYSIFAIDSNHFKSIQTLIKEVI